MTSPVAPGITFGPSPVLSDETILVRLAGFAPNQRVTLRAAMRDDAGRRWRSWAAFAADETGALDVAMHKLIKFRR